uniref:Uncharacterized protein n=1 Tax=Pristionchus pacificus TaxID=54126 RepID=A0A2A6C4X6_PRIPA|eukprot:PDM73272.1 hypothetical protein PRIPAC_40628 [Pristionchus pacificus]
MPGSEVASDTARERDSGIFNETVVAFNQSDDELALRVGHCGGRDATGGGRLEGILSERLVACTDSFSRKELGREYYRQSGYFGPKSSHFCTKSAEQHCRERAIIESAAFLSVSRGHPTVP